MLFTNFCRICASDKYSLDTEMQTKDTEQTTTSKKRPNYANIKQIYASQPEYNGDINYDSPNSSDIQNSKETPKPSDNKQKRKGEETMSVIYTTPDKTKPNEKKGTENNGFTHSEPAENENMKTLSVIYAAPNKNKPDMEKGDESQAYSQGEAAEDDNRKTLSVIYATPDKNKPDVEKGAENQAYSHNEPPENESESDSDNKRLSVIYAAPDKTKRDNKEDTMENMPDSDEYERLNTLEQQTSPSTPQDGIENGNHTAAAGNAYDAIADTSHLSEDNTSYLYEDVKNVGKLSDQKPSSVKILDEQEDDDESGWVDNSIYSRGDN